MNSPTLDALHRALDISKNNIELVGSTSPTLLAWLLTQDTQNQKPTVIFCANEKNVHALAQDILALEPQRSVFKLESFDESPYSGLYPNKLCIQNRVRFLWRAAQAQNADVFIGSAEAFLQKTSPLSVFNNFVVTIKKGDEVDLPTLMAQLAQCGYESTPLVEDGGTFSRRGDVFDVFSPSFTQPLRFEFFGDQVESIRLFDPESQRSENELEKVVIIPAREIFLTPDLVQSAANRIKKFCDQNDIPKESRENLTAPLKQGIYSQAIDYWIGAFYENPATPLDAFKSKPRVYFLDSMEVLRSIDGLAEKSRDKFRDQLRKHEAVPDPQDVYSSFEDLQKKLPQIIEIKKIHIESAVAKDDQETITFKAFDMSDLSTVVRAAREAKKDFISPAVEKIQEWKKNNIACFIWAASITQCQRIKYLFETHGLLVVDLIENGESHWSQWLQAQMKSSSLVHVISRNLSHSLRFADEGFAFIREEDLFGSRVHTDNRASKGTLEQRANLLSFGDLNPDDFVVHSLNGIGVYEGLKKMSIQGVENEYIQLRYRDNDKLYLPVYRIAQIQKYSGPGGAPMVDKLGSTSWQKAKVKVRNELKDVADELLGLYAKRKTLTGYSFSAPDDTYREFEATFPYDETPDQAKAINDVLTDMQSEKPMDRLVCGDVGFGKTEVAVRAAFKAIEDKKQVAVLVPTTILAFQHHQTFTKRLSDFAVRVEVMSRFTSSADAKRILKDTQDGKVDVLIGTHRLLSKDVGFKDLGLLIVDEEQKFGVTHKEKIKKFKAQIDVLTLSATPIPRTLNMALMGVRDLSIINSPPENRLSIRTFISRFDEETIRKAIIGETQRGGQTFFIHNRVQSINKLAEEIRQIVPEVRIRVAHGQVPEDDLEKTMLSFYNHEFDVLICTTIIESGLDIPRANTIIVDRADTFGLSQLYQLRGRVGRSQERAYAYLLIPPQGIVDKTAQERLRIIQENSELGSGFHIAHHDLELRGGGNILGESQSGHIATVGYELYMELLEEALATAKGETLDEEIEPEINLRVPALFPDTYIEDIRIRLSYYKRLSEIRGPDDITDIEAELVDRFGQIPEQVTNLFGVMLIRRLCKDMGIRDISSGPKNLSLIFSPSTKASPDQLIKLTISQNQKYQITPDHKLIVRMNSVGWMPIFEELKGLKKTLIPL